MRTIIWLITATTDYGKGEIITENICAFKKKANALKWFEKRKNWKRVNNTEAWINHKAYKYRSMGLITEVGCTDLEEE